MADNHCRLDILGPFARTKHMHSPLLRHLSVSLLALAMLAGPVLAKMPRCCGLGRTAGGESCCCSARQAEEPVEQSCCQARKSCCASHEEEPTEAPAASGHAQLPECPLPNSASNRSALKSLAPAGCCCKASSPSPAIPATSERAELDNKHLASDLAMIVDDLAPHRAAASRVSLRPDDPLKIPLRKIYCRWTV